MSTYEALRFLGLDYYATASDIKAAYRRVATDDCPDAERRMEMLNRAYAALEHRVGHTPPELDPLPGVEAVAKPKVATAGLRVLEGLKLGAERLPRLRFSGLVPPRVGRAAAVLVVMAAVGYGMVRGAGAKQLAPTVVDAEAVSASQVKPMVPVTVVEKASPVREKKSPVVAAAPRPLRAPALPGVDPVEAKAIDSACLAQTGERADAYSACVVRTARETPHAIHLD